VEHLRQRDDGLLCSRAHHLQHLGGRDPQVGLRRRQASNHRGDGRPLHVGERLDHAVTRAAGVARQVHLGRGVQGGQHHVGAHRDQGRRRVAKGVRRRPRLPELFDPPGLGPFRTPAAPPAAIGRS